MGGKAKPGARVFIAQRPSFKATDGSWASKYDLSPAERFGEIVEVLKPGTIISLQDSVTSIMKALREFTDDDFVLPIGDPAASGLVTTAALFYNRGHVKILRWNRHASKYVVERVRVSALEQK